MNFGPTHGTSLLFFNRSKAQGEVNLLPHNTGQLNLFDGIRVKNQ